MHECIGNGHILVPIQAHTHTSALMFPVPCIHVTKLDAMMSLYHHKSAMHDLNFILHTATALNANGANCVKWNLYGGSSHFRRLLKWNAMEWIVI